MDPRDQPLADVAREVEVDVGRLGDLVVEEAAEEEPGLDRVDVGEAGQVADDRGDARAAPAPRAAAAPARCRARGPRPRSRARARAGRGGAGRSPRGRAWRSPAAPPPAAARPRARCGGAVVALAEAGPAGLGELAVGRPVLGARVAVAEVAGQVEAEALGEPRRSRRPRRGARRSAPPSARASTRVAGAVAAPLGLGRLQRAEQPDGDERVLQRRPASGRGSGRCRSPTRARRARRELGQAPVAGPVAAPEAAAGARPGSGRGRRPPRRRRPSPRRRPGRRGRCRPGQRAVAGAAGEADEALGVLVERRSSSAARRSGAVGGRRLGRASVAPCPAECARGRRQQPAEVAVAGRRSRPAASGGSARRAVAAEGGRRAGPPASSTVSSVPVIGRTPGRGRPARTPSTPRARRGRSAPAPRSPSSAAAAAPARPGCEAPSRNEKAEWAWSSTYVIGHRSRPRGSCRGTPPENAGAFFRGAPTRATRAASGGEAGRANWSERRWRARRAHRCSYQPPLTRSRKTTRQRPPPRTSSK